MSLFRFLFLGNLGTCSQISCLHKVWREEASLGGTTRNQFQEISRTFEKIGDSSINQIEVFSIGECQLLYLSLFT